MDIFLEGGRHLRGPMQAFLSHSVVVIHQQSAALDVTPCGSGDDAIRRCTRSSGSVLLVDSEGVVSTQLVDRVNGQIGRTNHAFFMVQLMEAWFLADRETLTGYFGSGFRVNSLPRNLNVEGVPKQDVLDGLHSATRECRKGVYSKTKHAAGLLELINPTAVYTACPNFARLIDFLRVQAAV